jgi:DNA-binding transcriptional MerR regulator
MSFLSTKQVAERLGLKRHQVEYLIDAGIIRDASVRISNRRAFTEEDYSEASMRLQELKERRAEKAVKSVPLAEAV